MHRKTPFFAFFLLLLAGCSREETSIGNPPAPDGSGAIQITRPVARNNEVILQSEPANIPRSGDPIENTLNALFATATDDKGASAIPNGTRLLSLKVENGLATLNLNADFARLGEEGNTATSLAQNALRKALAQFPQVQRMTVLVEGKTFEDEHSGEWSDIPVRDASAGARNHP